MREITTIEDQINDRRVYDLGNGKRVMLNAQAVQMYGLHYCLAAVVPGYEPDMTPTPVYRSGRMVGTLPASFDPHNIRSSSRLYSPRRGDFTHDGEKWIADPMLGDGDLYAAGVTLVPETRPFD